MRRRARSLSHSPPMRPPQPLQTRRLCAPAIRRICAASLFPLPRKRNSLRTLLTRVQGRSRANGRAKKRPDFAHLTPPHPFSQSPLFSSSSFPTIRHAAPLKPCSFFLVCRLPRRCCFLHVTRRSLMQRKIASAESGKSNQIGLGIRLATSMHSVLPSLIGPHRKVL